MLNTWPRQYALGRARQHGVVLMMALIVLVAMTLAGIALVRSVDTSNVIAGNLAFQQAATNSGDAAGEAAVSWLQANAGSATNTLWSNQYAQGYSAITENPSVNQSWINFWNNTLKPAGEVVTLTTDAAGNTASYVIHRMCDRTGQPNSIVGGATVICANTPETAAAGVSTSSKTAGTIALKAPSQIYYRITTRIDGPRNTVSFVQTMVAGPQS